MTNSSEPQLFVATPLMWLNPSCTMVPFRNLHTLPCPRTYSFSWCWLFHLFCFILFDFSGCHVNDILNTFLMALSWLIFNWIGDFGASFFFSWWPESRGSRLLPDINRYFVKPLFLLVLRIGVVGSWVLKPNWLPWASVLFLSCNKMFVCYVQSQKAQ